MNPNSVNLTLSLKIATHFFAHDTLAYNDVLCILGLVTKGSAIHKMSSKLPLIEMFNLGCDTDLEHSNPIFSQDATLLMMIYHQTEFGCKASLV